MNQLDAILDLAGIERVKDIPQPREFVRMLKLFDDAFTLVKSASEIKDTAKQERLARGLGHKIAQRASRRLRRIVAITGLEPIMRHTQKNPTLVQILLQLTVGSEVEVIVPEEHNCDECPDASECQEKLTFAGRKFHD